MTADLKNQFDYRLAMIVIVVGWLLFAGAYAHAQYEGFTEPVKTVELASDENGIIKAINVSEGDLVDRDQVVVRLNDEIQLIQLELAEHLAHANANTEAAEKSYQKRKQIHEQLSKMREGNFVNENEVLRAELELTIAFAKWKSAQDELTARKIEWQRAKAVVENRKIKAPFSGVVARIHREVGEYVSPINSDVMTLIDDSQLNAVFNIPNADLRNLQVGESVSLQMESGSTVHGKVSSIGFVVDSESGTVVVKILIDNANRSIRAGEACTLNI
ncbi:MAG: efflux RND transporter periplasmic adaptor subunit [Pirellulaceae bacterium]